MKVFWNKPAPKFSDLTCQNIERRHDIQPNDTKPNDSQHDSKQYSDYSNAVSFMPT
jgi:hypothetical protein